MDQVYGALNDATRRKILELLKANDMTAGEIAQHFSITLASLSHHLAALKAARLVVAEREGKYIKYSLNTSVLEDALSKILGLLSNK